MKGSLWLNLHAAGNALRDALQAKQPAAAPARDALSLANHCAVIAASYYGPHDPRWSERAYTALREAAAALAQRDVPLTFARFREANVRRCAKWHPAGIESWSSSDWLTAVTGELGELASLLKMRNRERDGLPGNKFSPSDKQVADEIADVLTYLDLLAAALGVDLGAAAVAKFNEVSARVGFPDRIDAAPQARSDAQRDDDARDAQRYRALRAAACDDEEHRQFFARMEKAKEITGMNEPNAPVTPQPFDAAFDAAMNAPEPK